MKEYRQDNIAFWNELAGIHEKSSFYDLPSFMAGKQTLHDVELNELGDVRGKSLLHLQCHFGMDTLSWARAGARATGVDFSDQAIRLARRLASELELDARFIQSDVYELPQALDEQFDIVFTSYGVLCWLQDLQEWGRVISRFLKDGGIFFIAEEHPLLYIMDEKCEPSNLRIAYSYFDTSTLTFHDQCSYADWTAVLKSPVHYEWTHTLEEVFSAITGAGLRIESFHEYPVCMYQKFEWLVKDKDDWWRPPEGSDVSIPMLFSLKARK